jgi:ammonium transporter Rh
MASTKFAIVAGGFQLLLLLFFSLWARYDKTIAGTTGDEGCNVDTQSECDALHVTGSACVWDAQAEPPVCLSTVDGGVGSYYPFFQDVHVMMFIGFGFLMTFLKKYGYSAVGYNFLLAALAIQWSFFTNAFWHRGFEQHLLHGGFIDIDIRHLIMADFAAAAVLISFGGLLGKVSPVQLVVMVFFELIFYSLNEAIGVIEYQAIDMGGSIFIHTFGAYFGLAASLVLSPKEALGHEKNGASKNSDTFAMIGTIFLWMYWPSFNGALATGSAQHRVVVNTVLALCGCCVASFIWSNILRHGHKFDMVDIQNATLAGGVAVGSSSDLVIEPWGAILIGMLAGTLSVFGYVYISPFLRDKIGLQDTCGIHNLHGLPGLMGGIGGSISAAVAGDDSYGLSIGAVFPARDCTYGLCRTAGEQGAHQMFAVCTALVIAIVGGLFTGCVMNLPFFKDEEPSLFDDKDWWEVPHEEEQADSAHSVEMVGVAVTEKHIDKQVV